MKLPKNFCVIDCETSGLSPDRHALLSIGAITTSRDTFYRECLFDETREIDPAAMAVNGISLGLYNKDDVFPEQAITQLLDWLEVRAVAEGLSADTRWIFGGKNPQFDYGFLCATCANFPDLLLRLRARISRRAVDLHSLAYAWALSHEIDFGHPDFSTDMIYGQLGFQPEPKPHNALNGARLAMQQFDRILHVIVC